MYFNVQNAYDTLADHTPPGSKLTDKERDAYTIYESDFGHVLENPDYKTMQYTGLKDKLGNEIYEGDIVRYEGSIRIVVHVAPIFTLQERLNGDFEFGLPDFENCEVLGNIYQNPELLNY